MSTYIIPEFKIDLFYNARILDTNVLVGYFDENDDSHAEAFFFFDDMKESDKLLVPVGVIVEVLGLLGSNRGGAVSRETLQSRKLAFWNWLTNPGNNIAIISGDEHRFDTIDSLMASEKDIDCVDIMVSVLCHYINVQCNFRTNICVVSKDWRDLYRLKSNGKLRFGIYNYFTQETY